MEARPVVPKHLGIIMDGNGRWAQKRALPRTAGHLEGLKALKRVIKEASVLGIGYVTFYVFSTENWKRSKQEVSYLMHVLVAKLHGELAFYNKHGIRLLVCGDLEGLPKDVQEAIVSTVQATETNTTITCILAINYGGQNEICRAVNRCLLENPQKNKRRENYEIQSVSKSAGHRAGCLLFRFGLSRLQTRDRDSGRYPKH
ncbi:MAG: di-trans,poly-cis-decaprenylcistransferase [Spirochaetia bacterium]|nr:di-trans,poly-cis-decaprenylcistransferase [Spirochaetia bacterium]